jgi:hypothetical protein
MPHNCFFLMARFLFFFPLFMVIFLVVLGFELRASCLLGCTI